ncbi:MAG: GPW/gp25 family protein [Bacteroidota bacterium]
MDEFYNIPVRFSRLWFETGGGIVPKQLAKVGLQASVKSHIRLILMTRPGEYRYDREFGCSIWDRDFEIIPEGKGNWANEVEASIQQSLKAHEKRLSEIKVSLKISKNDEVNGRLKKVIEIHIGGKLNQTGEDFQHTERMMLSPISLE